MIKDKLTEAVEASLKNIKNGDDHIPLNMRGELEVIVKDRDDNIISYERGKNQVTDLAKMAIIHLLAGEIGAVDGGIWSVPETSGTSFQRTYTLSDSDLETSGARIISDFVPDNHTTTTNLDGQLISNEQYFYDGRDYLDESSNTNQLSQVFAKDTSSPALSLKFNFPTKMLFGTGLEAYNASTMDAEYAREIGTQAANLSLATELKLNGVSNATAVPESFFNGCSYAADTGLTANEKLTNWYSNTKFRSRTLQPATPDAINDSPTSTTTSIRGAIKNCFITNTTDGADRYNA